MDTRELARQARAASIALAAVDTAAKNRALAAIARAITARAAEIITANEDDLASSAKNNLASPLMKRLKFDQAKIAEVAAGIESLITLPDPVGTTLSATELDKGFELYRVSCPIGVIGVIFESRPDALVQISTLCLKSGNAVLLKGGSEAAATNRILAAVIAEAAAGAGMPAGWIQLLETRAEVNEMLSMDEYIDLIIPRGSNEFVRYIMEHSNIAVLGHADGICHVYVDRAADIAMAASIVTDSKCQYVAVCNAAETLLVHADIAREALPRIKEALDRQHVELRGCERTAAVIPVTPATDSDWAAEYLDYVLAVKIVDTIDEAIAHINTYGSGHTDAIVTTDPAAARRFIERVDTADVFWNCSTRFSDGFRFGLGAEVGVSTNKIHARGPVGLEGLVIYKWIAMGNGNIVADYAAGKRRFTHRRLNRPFTPPGS